MPRVTTYNPKKVTLALGNHIASGFADDSFIVIEPAGDGNSYVAGADGEVCVSVDPSSIYTVKVSVLQNSKTNAYCKKMYEKMKKNGKGFFPVTVKGAESSILETYLGKMGLVLHTFANGWDETPVSVEGYKAPIKSIGNSTTTPRDLVSELDVKIILMALSESVGARLRENGFQCRTVEISIRDNGLYHFTRQCKLDRASNLTEEIARTAFELFQKNYNWEHPIRSLGVRGCDLVSEEMPYQLDLFMDETKREKIKKMDQVVDEIRGRFGYQSIQRAFMYQDKILAQLNAKEHTVHPQAYFHG